MGLLTGSGDAAAGSAEQTGAVLPEVVWHRVDGPAAVAEASSTAIGLAGRAGLTEQRTAEVGMAVAGAASHLARHAKDGALLLRLVRTARQAGVEVAITDIGPAAADPPGATDSRTADGGAGTDLDTVVRLASSHDRHSVPGRGAVLTATFWPAGGADDRPTVDGITRPIAGEQACGDAWAVRVAGGRLLALLCDGLGHGPQAALAADAAVRAFLAEPTEAPGDLLRRLHGALKGSRGAAAAVASLDYPAGTLMYAGVGNIAGWLVSAGRRTGLLTFPGIVGHHIRMIRSVDYPLPADGMLVMHSDGVSYRWNLPDYPGLINHRPLTIAATLLRDAGIDRDDASVVVGKPPPQ